MARPRSCPPFHRSDSEGGLESRVLGLRLREQGMWLRLIDAATGELLLFHDEAIEKAERAQREAEQRVRALEEELARLRGEPGRG